MKKRNFWFIAFFVLIIIFLIFLINSFYSTKDNSNFINNNSNNENIPSLEEECSEDIDCVENYKCESKKCVPVGCVGEGEYTPGSIPPSGYFHVAHECCEGLKLLTWDDSLFGCEIAPTGGGFLCTAKCGNYQCEEKENQCTCPEDCTVYS